MSRLLFAGGPRPEQRVRPWADAALTPRTLRPGSRRQRGVSKRVEPVRMDDEAAEQLIQRVIGGNDDAVALIAAEGPSTRDPLMLVLGALLGVLPDANTLL